MTQSERDRILQSPFVRQVMDVFNARVVDIRPDRTVSPDPQTPGQEQES